MAPGPPLAAFDYFGYSVSSIGDLNGDGAIDLAVGAYKDDTGGTDRGAVHVLFLEPQPLLEVSVDTASISENGGAATGTATRSNVDDLTQPLTVSLSSGDTSEVAVPTTVTIPANQPSATFPG